MPDHDAPAGFKTASGAGLPSSDSLLKRAPLRPGAALSPMGIAAESDVRTHSPSAAAPFNPEEPPGWVENLGWLPLGYSDDRLVCMPRDPTCAFIYWDLSQKLIDDSFAGLHDAHARLKLIHLSGALLREVEVDLGMRGFYLRELPPGSEFRVELWAAGNQGARLLRSTRPVWLPPAEASLLLDEQYLHIWLDAPLSGSELAGTRPRLWRAAADFPGWSQEQGGKPVRADQRLGYPSSGAPAGPVRGAKP